MIPQIDPGEIGCAFHGAGAEIVKPGTRPKGGESKRSADKPGTHSESGESEPTGEDKNSHLWMETS